jgi:ATP-dependent RNA helicase DeaD
VRHLQAILLERGFSAVLLSGELSQHERNQSMQALRDGRARVCVATDVAARGIDLPNLGLVIHAELPNDAEVLQHRSGRTGRAGRKGVSALLAPPARQRRAEMLLRDAGVHARWSGPPTVEEIAKLDQQRLLQDPLLTEEPSPEELELARLLLAERAPEQLAAALVKLYRSRLPALEEVVDPGTGPSVRESREKSGRGAREPREISGRVPKSAAARFPEGAAWFRLDIGRAKNADPKWLLPMLCRKGDITKQDIGVIRIFDRETQFEVSEAVAARFAANMRRPGGEPVRVERMNEGRGGNETPARAKPEQAGATPRRRPKADKPRV